MSLDTDIRNLAKWLNEEQTAPIDRPALARLLAWAQSANKPAAWVYPEFFEGITKAGCWTAYAGDGSGAADGVKRIPLYRGALTGGDQRRHIICLCPDCTKPVQQREPVAWMDRDGDLYATEPDKNWCPPHTPLYTSPPAGNPLTDGWILGMWPDTGFPHLVLKFARAIEAAHGIKGDA